MSITVTANLKTRMAAGTTTLARLYTISRTDGTIYRFTDHSEDIVYNGNTYAAEASILMSAVYSTVGGQTQTAEAIVAFDDSFVREADVVNGFFDFAGFDVALIFGTGLIKDPLYSALPADTINMHLGLSPRYRGSARSSRLTRLRSASYH